MNFPNSLLSSIGLSIILGFFYLFVHDRHPGANKTLEVVEAALKGCAINAMFWILVSIIAFVAGSQNVTFWLAFVLVLDTSFLSVPFANLSLVTIPLAFAIDENSNGHIDYRVHAMAGICILAIILGVYYYSVGFPSEPIRFP